MTSTTHTGAIDAGAVERTEYPEPTPAMLNGDPLFDAIWGAIKGWDISRHNDGLYAGPTGNDARHVYDAVSAVVGDDAYIDRIMALTPEELARMYPSREAMNADVEAAKRALAEARADAAEAKLRKRVYQAVENGALRLMQCENCAALATPSPTAASDTSDLAEENKLLREALELIDRLHIPDQPAAFGGDELQWAQRHVATLRNIARAALRASKGSESPPHPETSTGPAVGNEFPNNETASKESESHG